MVNLVRWNPLKTIVAVAIVAAWTASSLVAQAVELNGTWSGTWIPKGGVRDAVTVQFQESGGKLAGKFLTPAPMDFKQATFNAKTGAVTFEATDEKSGKRYKIDGKVQGTEIRGTLTSNDVSGELHLIKWTYVPR